MSDTIQLVRGPSIVYFYPFTGETISVGTHTFLLSTLFYTDPELGGKAGSLYSPTSGEMGIPLWLLSVPWDYHASFALIDSPVTVYPPPVDQSVTTLIPVPDELPSTGLFTVLSMVQSFSTWLSTSCGTFTIFGGYLVFS